MTLNMTRIDGYEENVSNHMSTVNSISIRLYNLDQQINQTSICWPMLFTVIRAHRLLHDVRLLPKSEHTPVYAEQLWTTMLTVCCVCVCVCKR
jgi:hypothetical protein